MVPLRIRPQNLLLQAETSLVEGNRRSLVRRGCTSQELERKELELKLKDNCTVTVKKMLKLEMRRAVRSVVVF